MNIFAKKLGITMLTAVTAFGLMAPTVASAGESGTWQQERWATQYDRNRQVYPRYDYRASKYNYQGNQHSYRGNQRVYRHRGNDDAIALGIIGLGVGAIIGGAIANSHDNPRVIYQQPAAPRVIYQQQAAPRPVRGGYLEPWTQSWFNYCTNQYRSFNASTGTYRGYDGRDHFCVAK